MGRAFLKCINRAIFTNFVVFSVSAATLIAENIEGPNQDSANQVLITKDNWGDFSDFLLEPIAKSIANGNIELVADLQLDTESPLLDRLSRESGFFEISRSENTISNQKRNKGILFLSNFDSVAAETNVNSRYLSIFSIAPVTLKNWMYALKLTSEKGSGQALAEFSINSGLSGCRNVYIENTEDEIFASPVSFNDFFISAIDPKTYSEELLERKVMFVPYINNPADSELLEHVSGYEAELGAIFTSEQCKPVLQNKDVKVYPTQSLSSINPKNITVRKRNVNIVKRRYLSPFYEEAFEILILDVVNKFPYIRLIYNSEVKFQRAILYQWGSGSLSDSQEKISYVDFRGLVSFDKTEKLIFTVNKLASYPRFNEDCIKAKLEQACK